MHSVEESSRLAYRYTPGTGPTIVFLPGYASDMSGTKAVALEDWAKANGRAYVRFDYRGCGQSPGAFEEQTIAGWRDDVLWILDEVVEGPALLVGSSLGGWLMLLAARERPDRVAAMIGVAAAPDFTDWGFSQADKMTLLQDGRLYRRSAYSDEPTVYTRAMWMSGEANRVLIGRIEPDVPVRLFHGLEDRDVPWERSVALMQLLRSDDVQLALIKGGDHRLSREPDLARLIQAVAELSAPA